MKLHLPKPNTNYLKKSFSYSAASQWNSLPKVRSNQLDLFKKEMNRFYENEGWAPTRQPCKRVILLLE